MQSREHRLWVLLMVLLVGMGGVLYGYDIGVVSGALLFIKAAIPMTNMQTGCVVGAVLGGGLVGTLCAGPLADRFGRRPLIASACLIFLVGIACIISGHVFLTIFVARLLLGVGIGIISVVVPLYVAELVPAHERGKYVTFFQLFLTFGIVFAYFIDLLFIPSGNWRGMFAVVAIPAVMLLIGAFILPETPRWLIAHNHLERGKRILHKVFLDSEVPTMMTEIQNSLSHTNDSWRTLFSAKLFMPLLVGILVAVLNQLIGVNVFLQYAPSILKDAGMSSNFSSMMGAIGIGVLNFVFTAVGAYLVDRVGRKKLLIIGVAAIFLSEVFLAVTTGNGHTSALLGQLSMIGLFVFIIGFAIGPGVVVWLAITELLPTRVRGAGASVCLFFSSLSGTLISTLFPPLHAWIGISGTYWICSVFALIYLLVATFLLPETNAKSLEEIQHALHKQTT